MRGPVIARAPHRISFAGGGTDLAAYYEPYGGMVVSTAIDRYCYVLGSGRPDRGVGPRRGATEQALVEAALQELGAPEGAWMLTGSEVPSGSGLGSSSAAAAALVQAAATLLGRRMGPGEVAEAAGRIEIGRLGSPIGLQDQYASAYGGLNAITFTAGGVHVEPVACPPGAVARLEACTMLFFTGRRRRAGEILAEQTRRTQEKAAGVIESLHAIKQAAHDVRAALEANRPHLIGEILHETWQLKRGLAPGVSDSGIDRAYQSARDAGAVGGKLAGAGGGGFLMLYCEPEHQPRVTRALAGIGLERLRFRFDTTGVRVVSAPRRAAMPAFA